MPVPDRDIGLFAEVVEADELIIDERFEGADVEAPTLAGGFSQNSVRMGKKAASVLPEAVDAVKSTLSCVLKMASAAATWIERRLSQSWE